MERGAYRIFSEGQIGNLTLKNRLVRTATYVRGFGKGQAEDHVVGLYERLASGGVGLIITGALFPAAVAPDSTAENRRFVTAALEGVAPVVECVHSTDCRIVAQINIGGPSTGAAFEYPTPFESGRRRMATVDEIKQIVDCTTEYISKLKSSGFDGIQLLAGHGYFLSSFLSPYMNRRTDKYGGSVENRARIIREIVSRARDKVGNFPILIKMNGTDDLPDGTDIDSFPAMAREIAGSGVDAIEVSGGTLESLARSEEELGFPPIPLACFRSGIEDPEKQSCYLKYAEAVDLDIPIILVGGNRDVERLEQIVQGGRVAFISLCRPLISEPDLPNRWLDGRGQSSADCISCNACYYANLKLGGYRCLYKEDKEQYRAAREWLSSWVENNLAI